MSRMVKLTILTSLFALLAAGCWDRTEINDLALVTGAAIDKHDDNLIEVTIQIFVPRTGSGSGIENTAMKGGGAQTSFVRSAVGVNIADALSRLQEKLPRKIFWGHTEIIIFGEALARDGIRDDIDYLMRAPQPRERAFMYVCKGNARQILELNTRLERNTSEVMREIGKSKIILSVTMADLAQMLENRSGAAALPMIAVLNPGTPDNPDRSESFVNASAVFKNDKMVGSIDDSATRGLLWLRNEIKTAVITVTPEGASGHVSLRLLKSKTRLEPLIENGQWKMNVSIHTEDDALQNTTSMDLVADPEAVKAVEAAMNRDIENRVGLALRKLQKDMHTDILDFSGEFHRAYPEEWKQNKQHWDDIFPEVQVTVRSDAKMLRPGLSSVKSLEEGKEASR